MDMLQQGGESGRAVSYCLAKGIDALDKQPWGERPPPWAPGRREETTEMERAAELDKTWCLTEVDIFCDLSDQEMQVIADNAPMRTYTAGEVLFSPHSPVETLFILKRGRIRVFRVSEDGRALTTAIITPGTIFGEMVLLGQSMYDNFAEAIDESVVCVMSKADVHKFLMADQRIASRIAATLGQRLAEMERRLTESVFKSVPQRVASTLHTLAQDSPRSGVLTRGQQITLTHEQLAALVGTSRETATKVLGEFAEQGLLRLARGRITVLDAAALEAEAGE
ncbi:Crp/Fnr family transcriptional regulator [Phytoactinopolyspora endophytica]|uniref:Crp/Fnr family transcriptional regulator n=1 Tax=Phytoactinopolyspora endophytica TaxID=1642495 RepID=UPI00197B10DD|nr:Crp/Fnr family transcriptional regulator [Phytoactinopolyspora endophytica]